MDDGYPSLLPRPSVPRQCSVSYRHLVHGKREDLKKSISTVKDGYGQSAALLGTDLVDGSTLWVNASGPDRSVKKCWSPTTVSSTRRSRADSSASRSFATVIPTNACLQENPS